MKRFLLALAALAALALPAAARTTLSSSDPAQGAKVGETAKITLHFSGNLQPAQSGAALVGPSGKEIPVASAVGTTAITLLPFRLKPGRYRVDWHTLGQDQSKDKGTIAFTVSP